MRRLTDAAAWLIAPGFLIWKIWKRFGGKKALPWRAFLVHSLTRAALVVAIVWLIIQSQWWPAAVAAATLITMAFVSAFVTGRFAKLRSKQ